MMTASVNAIPFRNLSLVCRESTERISPSTCPSHLSPIKHTERKSYRAIRTVSPIPRKTIPTPTKICKKRSRPGVRFAPETFVDRSSDEEQRPRAKKRRRMAISVSDTWYTRKEIKTIQKSCAYKLQRHVAFNDVVTNEDEASDVALLTQRFAPQSQQQRKAARSQAYETIKAIQAYEKATNTKAPAELLSTLLARYSMSRVIEANCNALQVAQECL